ncbi:MAG: PQQ-binding-like beta-propeller repeat protein [Acidobacteriota bacterium]|nr:PQQ-binding-like beta-propeller repeat protein [Acidobacteriota bacterium]
MQEREIIYAAISGTILAIEVETGREVWRQAISKGTGVTTIYPRGSRVIAAAAGELWALDAQNGQILWHNKLKGLGLGFVCLSGAPMGAAQATMAGGEEAALLAVIAATADGGGCESADCGGAD